MKMYLPPPGRRDTRRGFLKKGLLGGVVLALGGGGWLALRRGARVTVPAGLLVLDERDYPVVLALIHLLLPRRTGFPPPERLDTARAVDGILAMMDDSARQELKQLFLLFENALPGLLFGGRLLPFTQLPEDEQGRVLLEWRDSRLVLRRSGFLALRTLVLSAYYGDAAVWPAVGYPGPPPGIHEPSAPEWRGVGERPAGNGAFAGAPAPGAAPDPAQLDGGAP